MDRQRVLSGMRPTGKLHLGHLHGTLGNWVKLQDEYECFFFVADWHALTSEYENTEVIKGSTQDMVIDWLCAGIDPEKSTLFIQSNILEHAELHLLLSMIVPLPWLERNPTYKEQQEEMSNKDLTTYGFLGYPVLQAADIIIYMANLVPIGVDQLPHVELTREITRRFNHLYGETFPVPEPILTELSKVTGLDGRKMSKSYNNAIHLSDDEKTLQKKVSSMVTDVQRARRKDPGDPEKCNLFPLHPLYSKKEEVDEIRAACPKAAIGCVDCKKILLRNLISGLAPIHEKQRYYQEHPQLLDEIIADGTERARAITKETMVKVRAAVKLS